MNRKNIFAITSVLLVSLAILAMTEEEQMQQAIQMSEQSAAQKEREILKPGQRYVQYIDIHTEFGSKLPTYKEKTRPFKVYQIAVNDPQHSENVSCGPRVLFIAHAIDALYKKGTAIGAKTIEKELSTNANYTSAIAQCSTQLDAQDFPMFITDNDLSIEHYYIMGRFVGTEGLYRIYAYALTNNPETLQSETTKFEGRLKILGQDLEERKINHPIHFIFTDTTKKHWVLITVIKHRGSAPVIYYIDPKNVGLTSYVAAHNYIEYVVDKLELPFPKNK